MTVAAILAALAALGSIVAAALLGLRWRGRLRELTSVASTDDLTGIANRWSLTRTHQAMADAGTRPAVVLLDLTLFKDVNDRFGHHVGDAVLHTVAGRLATVAAREGGVVGRLGGDEFVLLLPNATTESRMVEVAGVVCAAVGEPIQVDGAQQPLTVSCVVGLAGPEQDAGGPFRAADIALYHARHHGLPYAVYRPGMTHPTVAHRRYGPRLRDHRPAPPVVVFDRLVFDRLVTGQASIEVAAPDEIDNLRQLIGLLDPAGRDFGTDVADLVGQCAAHGVLRHQPPITQVSVIPTTLGEYRDGGFLVLVRVADAVTVASGQVHPRTFLDHRGTDIAAAVLAGVVEMACRTYADYGATATTSLGGPR